MIRKGTTRIVLLFGKAWAIKFPRPLTWKTFLKGFIANMDERMWYTSSPDEWREKMCPNVFCGLGGLFLICKYAEDIDLEDYQEIDLTWFEPLPMDTKLFNFGRYQGRIVLRYYADSKYFCSDCEGICKLKNDTH